MARFEPCSEGRSHEKLAGLVEAAYAYIMSHPERHTCPACGGAGGGPIGRANSAWDIESYECPRCEGAGFIEEAAADAAPIARPGIVKATPVPVMTPRVRRGSSAN